MFQIFQEAEKVDTEIKEGEANLKREVKLGRRPCRIAKIKSKDAPNNPKSTTIRASLDQRTLVYPRISQL